MKYEIRASSRAVREEEKEEEDGGEEEEKRRSKKRKELRRRSKGVWLDLLTLPIPPIMKPRKLDLTPIVVKNDFQHLFREQPSFFQTSRPSSLGHVLFPAIVCSSTPNFTFLILRQMFSIIFFPSHFQMP